MLPPRFNIGKTERGKSREIYFSRVTVLSRFRAKKVHSDLVDFVIQGKLRSIELCTCGLHIVSRPSDQLTDGWPNFPIQLTTPN